MEIVGFDLGHGETAVSVTRSSSSSPPQIVEMDGKNSIITAVALSSTGYVIGEDAYECENQNLSQLSILFKSYQLDNPRVSEPTIHFVKEYLNKLSAQKTLKLDNNTWFFVGSPSGWTDDDRKAYEKVLRKAGMSNVIVRAESRAAFLDARETGVLNESFEHISDSVLIIDIGSSTTDFTLVKKYQEIPLDFGHNNLGGGLVDKQIFDKLLSLYSPSEKEIILTKFNENPSLQSKCLLKCREVKEKYFLKPNNNNGFWKSGEPVDIDSDEDLEFKVKVYKKDMEEILQSPIKELGKSWPNAFRDELQKCKESSEFQTVKLILMTGGGSRMKFTYDICHEEFPEARIIIGLDPALTIAKGLALLGRIDFKLKDFRDEVDEFIESSLLKDIVSQELSALFDAITNTFTEKFLEIAKRNFKKWANGDVNTVGKMQEKIQSETKQYFNQVEGYSVIKNDVIEWLDQVSSKIEPLTFDICDKYQLPRTAFNLSIETEKPKVDVAKLNISDAVGETAASFVGLIVGFIVFMISMPFMASGPMGWILGIALAFVSWAASAVGIGDWAKDMAKNLDIPLFFRDLLLSEEAMNQEIEKQRPELEKAIKEELEKNLRSERKLSEIFSYIKSGLYQRADEAAIVIKTSEKASLMAYKEI